LAVLDKCGKPIQGSIDDKVSPEEIQALADEVKSGDNARVEEAKKQFKEKLNTEGITISPGQSFNIGLASNNFYDVSNIILNNNSISANITLKKDLMMGSVYNASGDNKWGRIKMTKGDKLKVNFTVTPVKINQNKLKRLTEDGTIYQIPNLNGYFVYRELKNNGVTYPNNTVITPTT